MGSVISDVCVCVIVYPHSKRKTAWAILSPHQTYIYTHTLHGIGLASIVPEIKRSKFKVTHTQPFYGSIDFVRDNQDELVPEETFTLSIHLPKHYTNVLFSLQCDRQTERHTDRQTDSSRERRRPMMEWLASKVDVASVWTLISDSSILTKVSSALAQTHTARRPCSRPDTPPLSASRHPGRKKCSDFSQTLSSFRSTCPYRCSTEIMSSNPSLSLNSILGTLSYTIMPHIHLTILISALWNPTSFSFLTGQVSLPCNILLCTQLLYNVPLTINDIGLSLLVSNGTNCLN